MTIQFVPIEDLARTLTVSITTVRAWVRTGLIPGDMYVKIGNTYRFDKESIIEYFKPKKLVVEAVPPQPSPEPEADAESKMEQLGFDFYAIDVDQNL
jgi:excisionase family DNA binding protein